MSQLTFILTGFALVITVLAFLWLVCVIVGFLLRERSRPASAETGAPEDTSTPVPAHHLAAISTALAAMIPGPYRIVRVQVPGHITPGWLEQGRIQILASHRVRWDWATPGPGAIGKPVTSGKGEANK